MSIIGMTVKLSIAPPVIKKSVKFIATSILIIEINDIPKAVDNARLKFICFKRIIVSKIILVINPFITAKNMILKVEIFEG